MKVNEYQVIVVASMSIVAIIDGLISKTLLWTMTIVAALSWRVLPLYADRGFYLACSLTLWAAMNARVPDS